MSNAATPLQLNGLSQAQTSQFLTLATEASDVLRGPGLGDSDPDYLDMKAGMTDFRKLVSQVKPGQLNSGAFCRMRFHQPSPVIYLHFEKCV